MDTDRIIPRSSAAAMSQNGSSPGSAQSGQMGQPSYLNSSGNSTGLQQPNNSTSGLIVNSIARKKKTERLVPPVVLNHGGLVNGSNNIGSSSYLNSSAGIYSPMQQQAGITNHGYTRDTSGMVGMHGGGRLNTTGDTTVSMQDDSDEHQEVIEVQILPQDENWGETNTQVTAATSDIDYGGGTGDYGQGLVNGGFPSQHNGGSQNGGDLEKWRLDTERGMGFRCRRHAGPLVAGLLSMLAFISPILMAGLPKLGVLGVRQSQLQCGVECDGMLVSLAFKLFTLVVGTWAVFMRRTRSTLPRVHIYRALVCLLILVFLVSFWLFYASHVMNETERVEYKGLVQFALHLVDSLLFVHYLAVVLMELRHRQSQYYVKVLRSPDGESKGFPIGEMSVQRAAAWVLDKYYTEFTIYNPYLDKVTGARNRKGVKMYDVDGPNGNDGNSTVVSVASNKKGFSSHNERFYEEYEYERKLKKRKARLVTAAEEAFTHIKRMQQNQTANEKTPMESYEAAQAIFPTLSRPLQKYLRVTRQQPRHTVESILQHLSTCLSFDLSPRAFLEKYLITSPVLQNEREVREVHSWALVSERLLYRDIQPGTIFQLRQGDISLLCQVTKLPHFHLSEEIIDHQSNRFVLRINSETSV